MEFSDSFGPRFHYDPPTDVSMSGNPTLEVDFHKTKSNGMAMASEIINFCLQDPYEARHVVVRSSGEDGRGEGLFTTAFVPQNTLVSFYNGLRVANGALETYFYTAIGGEDKVRQLESSDTRLLDYLYNSTYLMALDNDTDIYVSSREGIETDR